MQVISTAILASRSYLAPASEAKVPSMKARKSNTPVFERSQNRSEILISFLIIVSRLILYLQRPPYRPVLPLGSARGACFQSFPAVLLHCRQSPSPLTS
jgi:hypothetical protein